MTALHWQEYEPKVLTKVNANTYAIRMANTVSDLTPSVTKLFGDRLLVVNGHYNQRGYCVGYSLDFEGTPTILAEDFYLVLDYLEKDRQPRSMSYPKLTKKDPSICLVKFGELLENRMYVFIHRRKKSG